LCRDIKGKAHPITAHDGPEGKKMYSCTLSLTSALDGVGGQRNAPAALHPRKTRYPLYRRLSEPQYRSGRGREISPPIGIRSPARPTHSEALYRQSYLGPKFCLLGRKVFLVCVVSGFRRDVCEICALLVYYAAYSSNSFPTFRDNLSGQSSRNRR
jgi:hypothetical protein